MRQSKSSSSAASEARQRKLHSFPIPATTALHHNADIFCSVYLCFLKDYSHPMPPPSFLEQFNHQQTNLKFKRRSNYLMCSTGCVAVVALDCNHVKICCFVQVLKPSFLKIILTFNELKENYCRPKIAQGIGFGSSAIGLFRLSWELICFSSGYRMYVTLL